MIKVKIVGAGGYGGLGAIEILSRHPEAKIVSLIAKNEYGKKISEIYPGLENICDLIVRKPEEDTEEADVVFCSTPDQVGMTYAGKYSECGCKIIDYSGDFRFNNIETYCEYAKRIGKEAKHASENLLSKSVYGLPELHREEIKNSSIIGNPGCFAVSCILGAAPLVKYRLADPSSFIFDAKTGVSGAGKKVNPIFHFPHRYEEMNAYKIGKHQHVFEIENELNRLNKSDSSSDNDSASVKNTNSDIKITFTAQVLPIVRGIMTTIYATKNTPVSYDDILDAYKQFYKNEPFVYVYEKNNSIGNRAVRGTNKCALWINLDIRTNKIIIISHIDNLVKGQAGNAVQNMNLMCGLPETMGLITPAMYP